MDVEKRLELIKRNVAEILTEQELVSLLREKKRLFAYYGTAPTGPFHIGYLVPLSKLFDFMSAGIKTKILLADIHAALDDLKTPWEETEKRTAYYKKCIELALPWQETPNFVIGSSFQLEKAYSLDVLKLSTLTTVERAKRAASEVTRMKSPKVSELIYPIMQALDEEYLGVDMQLGGLDQRHIFAYAREWLPKLGYKKRVEIMTPLVLSLKGPGTKMSASIPASHIKIYDSEEQIAAKLSAAYCPAGEIANNPVLQICRHIIFPIVGRLTIERQERFGGRAEFESYAELEQAFVEKKLHPADLKKGVADALTKLFSKARKWFEQNKQVLEELGQTFLP